MMQWEDCPARFMMEGAKLIDMTYLPPLTLCPREQKVMMYGVPGSGWGSSVNLHDVQIT